MKIFTFVPVLLLAFAGIAQQPINVTVSGNIFNAKVDTVYLSQYFGPGNYQNYQKAVLSKKGDFSMKATLPYADYYVIRVGESHINLIMRPDSDIKVYVMEMICSIIPM